MFICDILVGKAYVPRSSNEVFPKKGYDSTWAKASVSNVINDEVIVYQDDRCNPIYLLEFK
jgi:poly [ADP-ribose] polymerase